MGLGDYSVIGPGGSRVTYGGNDPNAGGTVTTPPVAPPSPYEGMFIQDTNLYGKGPIYLVQNGQKHWVPDQTTLDALGGFAGQQMLLPTATINAIPTGAPEPSITIQQSTVSQPVSPAGTGSATPNNVATATTTTAATTPTSNYVATTPTYSSVLETGATYNSSTGYYTNPDGTIYMPATTTSTFDLASPSTWPTWVWLALAAGASWLLIFKRR